MFDVIRRTSDEKSYLAVVLKETADHLYVSSPSLSKVSSAVRKDGALVGLTTAQLALLWGRGFARLANSQDFDVEDSFESLDEAVAFINGVSFTPDTNNPIKNSIVTKYMNDKTVTKLASMDEQLEQTTVALGTIVAFATSLQQKVKVLSHELNNRATARDVKGIQASVDKITAVLKAMDENDNIKALVTVGTTLSSTNETFDANEYLGLE